MEVYLIQRGKFKVDGKPTGFVDLIACDYMGSAEFEFGALPTSLKAITKNLDKFSVNKTDLKCVDGRGLFVICVEEQLEELKTVLTKLAEPNERKHFHLKEPSHLHDALNQVKYGNRLAYSAGTEFWWDVENHWMACLGKVKAETILKGLGALKDRWQGEGKI